MSVAELLEPIGSTDGPIRIAEAGNWMQGRTMYGGASALIAYTAALRSFPDLPQLRAGQVGFVAPVGDRIEVEATIVREGRNVVQVRSEIRCEGKLALTSFWLFGTAREPNAVHRPSSVEKWPGVPETNEPVMEGKGPAFIQNNFEIRRAQSVRGPGEPVVRRWIRLKEPSGLDPVSEMILLGDTLPPSAIRAMQRQGPISSINWSMNILDPKPETKDGWWLAETASDHADYGYSSERLRLWNTDGKIVQAGLQSVAVFG